MKVLWIVLAVFLLLIVTVLAGAWAMFGEKLTAARSVKKLEHGLYCMEYRGDYGFDKFLEQGGAASEAVMAQYIAAFLSNGFVKTAGNPVPQNFGCSTLTIESANLMGRNFDWEGTGGSAMIVHTIPKDGYESYSTCYLDFLGFGENWKPEGFANQYMSLAAIYIPLDGINEQGLCVADLVNGDSEQTHQNTDKPDLTTSSAIRLLLDCAGTVEEALTLLSQYDMNSAIGMSHHLAISDATGRSVVVEYISNEMIITETTAVTNHYLSAGEKRGIGNAESHTRFEKLMEMHPGITTAEELKQGMEYVSYPDITRWSIVYDLNQRSFDFYWRMQFDRGYHFQLTAARPKAC